MKFHGPRSSQSSGGEELEGYEGKLQSDGRLNFDI